MKLTNKLLLLLAALSVSACLKSVDHVTLGNGDKYELATISNLESEGSVQRIYRGGRVIAQEAIFDDSVAGDVVRSAVPVGIAQVGQHLTATKVAKIKANGTVAGPQNVFTVNGGSGGTAQAISTSDSASTSSANQKSQKLGPCGQPSCPQLGSKHLGG